MASLVRQRVVSCQCQRSFSTSARRPINLQWEKNNAEALAAVLPPYPHGPTLLYKQSRSGLYGGQRIRFGNNRGEKFNTRTRRTFKPNILTRRLFSKALNRPIQLRVSARVLRTIDKLGGIDEYLLGEKEQRIKELGESGWWLRWVIMQTPAIKNRFAQERIRLGLPADGDGNAASSQYANISTSSIAIDPQTLGKELQEMSLASEAAEDIRDSEIYSAMEESDTKNVDLKTTEEDAAEELQVPAEQDHIAMDATPASQSMSDGFAVDPEPSDPYTILSNLNVGPKIRPNSRNASKYRLIDGKWYCRIGLTWRPWTPKPFSFRVGRGKHLQLTAHGWRRTRPDSTLAMMQSREHRYRGFVQDRTNEFVNELNATVAEMPVEDRPTRAECLNLIRQAKAEIHEEVSRRLEKDVVEARKTITRRRLAKRTEKNKVKRAQEEAKKAEQEVEEQVTIM